MACQKNIVGQFPVPVSMQVVTKQAIQGITYCFNLVSLDEASCLLYVVHHIVFAIKNPQRD